jgi:DNA-directed RNA polymerase subunit RPC12/RpoP
MADVENPKQYKCKNCQTPVNASELRCPKCGTNLTTPGNRVALEPVEKTTERPAVVDPFADDRIACPNCSYSSDKTATVCIACGHALGIAFLEFALGGRRIPLPIGAQPFYVGRDPVWAPMVAHLLEQCDEVSGEHARINPYDTIVTITDWDSLNGTWINGTKIEPKKPIPLSDGDTLDFSRQVRAKFRMRK